jgi:hypothetical protein
MLASFQAARAATRAIWVERSRRFASFGPSAETGSKPEHSAATLEGRLSVLTDVNLPTVDRPGLIPSQNASTPVAAGG